MSEHLILRVEFAPDAVLLDYLTVPDDLRETGLHLTHRLTVPMDTDEYALEVNAVNEALQDLLRDALEDVANLPPYNPEDEQDDDDAHED